MIAGMKIPGWIVASRLLSIFLRNDEIEVWIGPIYAAIRDTDTPLPFVRGMGCCFRLFPR
jgi:hypothetical protein